MTGGAVAGSRRSSSTLAGAGAAAGAAPASGCRRTETRIPLSSIVTSATPDSWTTRTISRIRSARGLVDPARLERVVAPRPAADGAEKRLGLLAEEPDEQKLLLARGETLGLLPHVLERDRILVRSVVGHELDRAFDRRVDGAGRRAVLAQDELAQFVDDRQVALRREHVNQRLRAEDLADRSGERRRTDLRPDSRELLEHVVEAVAAVLEAQARVDAGDETCGQAVLGRADGDPRRQRRDRLVADVLVDDLGRLPECGDVDARVEAEAGERLRKRLPRHAVDGERDRIDGAGREVGADADRLERRGHCVAARALRVDADGQAAGLADALDQLGRAVRAE